MGRNAARVILGVSVVALVSVGIILGQMEEDSMAGSADSVLVPRVSRPLLDTIAPTKTETATFALG
ncbi:MAG: hypothetical protein ISS55_09235 [Dehalococcoidales bacterium]|nr:hypothetical protein [Dehalococcoidales bacterium]